MGIRRSAQIAVAAAVLLSPFAAVAQFAASVTTDPAGGSAPALTMPMLVVLAIVLCGVAAYGILTRSSRTVAGVALIAGLSLVANLSHANLPIVVQGADCNTRTTQSYNPGGELLTSLCPNAIQIVALDCSTPVAPELFLEDAAACTVGLVLANAQSCRLPTCGPAE